MRDKTDSSQNSPIGLVSSMPWRSRSVAPLENYCLSIQFMDGLQGQADLSGLILDENPGVFIVLRDVRLFKQVYLDHGAVTWPGNLDLAPDAMYQAIKKSEKYEL